MISKKRALVTGGAGFIGSHLTEELVQRGFEVTVLDNCATGNKKNLVNVLNEINFIQADIMDEVSLNKAMANQDIVFHLAALPSVPFSIENPLLSCDNNIGITARVLEAAHQAMVKRVVFISSSSVYGDQEELLKHEEMSLRPLSPYAAYKAAGELLCRAYSQSMGLDTVVARLFNVYGPRQNHKSQYAAAMSIFTYLILHNKPIKIFGDGLQQRAFTYVENVVEGLIALGTSQNTTPGEIFNIATEESISVIKAVETISQSLNKKADVNYLEKRPGEIFISQANINKAKSKLGFKPKIDFVTGIERTANWFKSQELNRKIILATGMYPPSIGGPAKISKWLVDNFEANNKQYQLIVLPILLKKQINFFFKLFIKAKNVGLSLIRLYKTVNRQDVIFTTDSIGAGLPSVVIGRLKMVPIVIRLGGDPIWERSVSGTKLQVGLKDFYEKGYYYKKYFLFLISKISLNFCHKIICPSELLKGVLVKYYKIETSKIVVIPNPIDIKINFENEIRNNKKMIFIGRLIELKNVVKLAKAFLDAKLDEWQLIIIGDGDSKKEVEAVALTNPQKIKVLGQKNELEIKEQLNQANWLLLPSYSDVFPNVVFEAIGQGVPAAISKDCGLPLPIMKAVYIFDDVYNQQSITKDLAELIKKETQARVINKIENVNWQEYKHDVIFRDYLEVFNSL